MYISGAEDEKKVMRIRLPARPRWPRIIIVDDSHLMRECVADAIDDDGFSVDRARFPADST